MKKFNRVLSILLTLALMLGCVFPMSLFSAIADTSTEYDKLVSFDLGNLEAAAGESVKATMNSGASYSGQSGATIVKMTDDGNYYRGVLTANGAGGDQYNVVAKTPVNSSTEGLEWMADAATLSALSPYLVYTFDYRITGLDGATVPSDGKLYVNAANKNTGRAFSLFNVNMTGATSWKSSTVTGQSREAVAWTDGYLGFSIYSYSKGLTGSYQIDIRNLTISFDPNNKATINQVLRAVGSSYTYGTLTGTDDEAAAVSEDITGTIGNWGTDATNYPYSEEYDENVLLKDNDSNNFVLTLTTAKVFSLEADITFSNGKTAGFVFNSSSATNASNWIGVVCNGKTVRLYHANASYLDISVNVPDGAIVDNKFHLKLVGGYVGLVSKNADVEFDNVYYYEATQKFELTNIGIENATIDLPFQAGDDNISATATQSATSVKVTPYAEGNTVIYVNGTKTASGSGVSVNLKSTVGYNRITIKTQSPEGYFAKATYLYVLKPANDVTLYDTDVRPQNHFSVPYGWLNDPNGMLYNAKTGEYHMFYQAYNISQSPSDAKQWAHAVSKDLVHWEDYPMALYADDYWMWSGSGVIDYNNTAGLYDESTDPAERMVLIYTTRLTGYAKINLAYTTDGGVTWEKYNDGKPLENSMGQDPKVFWYEDETMENGGIWIGLDTGSMYTSPDLKNWTINSRLKYKNGDTIGWECPDMYRIKIEGTDEYKWVYSGGGSYYLIGEIVKDKDGVFSFVPETDRLIYNGDAHVYNTAYSISGLTSGNKGALYATQHFYAAPDDRIINISWMKQTYEKLDSTGIWNGAMSVPMETKFIDSVDGLRLTSYPVEEYDSSRGEKIYCETSVEVTPDSENILSEIEGSVLDFEGVFTPDEKVTEFGFKLRVSESGDNYVTVKYDNVNKKLYADFSNSGDSAYVHSRNIPVTQLENGKVKFRILLDKTILDVFVNDGLAPISSTYRCDADNIGVEFYTVGGNVTIDSMDVFEMNPYWKDTFSAEDLAALRKILLGVDNVKYYVEDFNGDNKVDIRDLIRLKKILAK